MYDVQGHVFSIFVPIFACLAQEVHYLLPWKGKDSFRRPACIYFTV
jgi:hypothetical protein